MSTIADLRATLTSVADAATKALNQLDSMSEPVDPAALAAAQATVSAQSAVLTQAKGAASDILTSAQSLVKILSADLSSPTPVVVTAPVAAVGTDARTVIDAATGAPSGVSYEGTFMVLAGMAGADGVIRLSNRFFAGPVVLNCGSVPVEIKNCLILHGPNERGISGGEGTHLTMYDCGIYGTAPTMDGNSRERGIYLYHPSYVDIHHVTNESNGGIIVDHWAGTDSAPCRFRNLKSRNIIGKNGDYRHAIQLSNVHTSALEISYLESYNEPGKSRIEDHVNIYNSGGTSATDKMVGRGFYLHGSYPFPLSDTTFSGAALSADGSGNASEQPSAFIDVQDAWLVSNCGAAANIATGNNISYKNLTAVTSGYLPDGTQLGATYRGFWIGDYYGLGAGANNTMSGIKTRFIRTKDVVRRADFIADPNDTKDIPNVGIDVAGAVLLPDPKTTAKALAQEADCFIQWRDYLNANNQTVGSRFIYGK